MISRELFLHISIHGVVLWNNAGSFIGSSHSIPRCSWNCWQKQFFFQCSLQQSNSLRFSLLWLPLLFVELVFSCLCCLEMLIVIVVERNSWRLLSAFCYFLRWRKYPTEVKAYKKRVEFALCFPFANTVKSVSEAKQFLNADFDFKKPSWTRIVHLRTAQFDLLEPSASTHWNHPAIRYILWWSGHSHAGRGAVFLFEFSYNCPYSSRAYQVEGGVLNTKKVGRENSSAGGHSTVAHPHNGLIGLNSRCFKCWKLVAKVDQWGTIQVGADRECVTPRICVHTCFKPRWRLQNTSRLINKSQRKRHAHRSLEVSWLRIWKTEKF